MAIESVTSPVATAPIKSRSLSALAWRRFRTNGGAMVGSVVVLLIVLAALAAPLLAQYNPTEQNLGDALLAPSSAHLFGTDQFGRDNFARVLFGARISLRVGLISVGIACLIGVPMGLLSGYFQGWVDLLSQRLIDLLLAFPAVLLAMAIMTMLGPSLNNAMIAVGISIVPQFARIARGSTLTVKTCDYVTAARTVGCTNLRILMRHILPNIVLPLIVLVSLQIAAAILFAAGLSFLGLGAQPPSPEWGAMLTTGRVYVREAWWIPVFPGLAITVTVLAMNLVGDGLRDALDPEMVVR